MTSFAASLGLAAVSGAFTLLDPQDWPRSVRAAYVYLPALGMAGYVGYQMAKSAPNPSAGQNTSRDPNQDKGPDLQADSVAEQARPTVSTIGAGGIAAVSAVTGVGVAAVCAASFPVDRGIRELVARAGATHPRRWMAAGVVVLSMAIDVAERRCEVA